MGQYKWQGEPVEIEHGLCCVKQNKNKPLFWYNYECSQGISCIPAIKVITKDVGTFVISNHYGIGIHKLENGGYPSHKHFSLDKENFKIDNVIRYDVFDLKAFKKHESERTEWQRRTFPKEFAELQKFKEKGISIINNIKAKE